jgi:hypothetical protein
MARVRRVQHFFGPGPGPEVGKCGLFRVRVLRVFRPPLAQTRTRLIKIFGPTLKIILLIFSRNILLRLHLIIGLKI